MKKLVLLLLLIVVPSLVASRGVKESDEVDPVVLESRVGEATSSEGEIYLQTDPLFDVTMREAQLKLSRQMGTDPLFSGR